MNSLAGVRRVHIIGGGGAGKTTLARRLATRLGVPQYELDVPGTDLTTLLDLPAWVSDGVYLYGIEPVLDRADVIVWLDLPWRVAVRRIVTRHVRLSLTRRNPHRGLRLLYGFVTGQRFYYTSAARLPSAPTDWGALSRAATEILLRGRGNVVHLRTPRDVQQWLQRLGAPP